VRVRTIRVPMSGYRLIWRSWRPSGAYSRSIRLAENVTSRLPTATTTHDQRLSDYTASSPIYRCYHKMSHNNHSDHSNRASLYTGYRRVGCHIYTVRQMPVNQSLLASRSPTITCKFSLTFLTNVACYQMYHRWRVKFKFKFITVLKMWH